MGLIIFDLDGTLVDSLPDLVHTVNAAMADHGAPPVTAAEVGPWVGQGSRVLLGAALRHHGIDPQAPGFDFEAAFARFLDHYGRHLAVDSRLYDGVPEVLAVLRARGERLAICTNKPARFVGPLLDRFGIADRFEAWLGGDSLAERKPSPVPLQYLARQLGVAIDACAMVGDSRHDVEAARAAPMPVAGVRYGYGAADEFRQFPPDVVLDRLRELPDWIGHGRRPA